jgi:hypothetical protein
VTVQNRKERPPNGHGAKSSSLFISTYKSVSLCQLVVEMHDSSASIMPDTAHRSGHSNMDNSKTQERAQRDDAPPARLSGQSHLGSNVESLYNLEDEYWGAVILPDWSNAHTIRRSKKPRNWCHGCQCEHPWPKDGYSFHVRSRRANAYLRSLQLFGFIPNIDPLSVEPLAEVSEYRVSKDVHKMGMELLGHLQALNDYSSEDCCLHPLLCIPQPHSGYASFKAPSNAQEFLDSARGADPITKWNEYSELIHKQHRDSFPTCYTEHTDGVPRYFY